MEIRQKPTRLARQLTELYQQALAAAPNNKHIALTGGLLIYIQIKDDYFILSLARKEVSPSEQELKTVIDHMPVIDGQKIVRLDTSIKTEKGALI